MNIFKEYWFYWNELWWCSVSHSLYLNNCPFQAQNSESHFDSALILSLYLSRSGFFIYKITESNEILFKAWSSSKIWFYFEGFEKKNSPPQIATKLFWSFLQKQFLINFPFHVSILCPRNISIIMWWFQRFHTFHRDPEKDSIILEPEQGLWWIWI